LSVVATLPVRRVEHNADALDLSPGGLVSADAVLTGGAVCGSVAAVC